MKAIWVGLLLMSTTVRAEEFNVVNYLEQGGLLKDVTGLVMPADWAEAAAWDNVQVSTNLPSEFDWNDHAKLQAIRNQGGCGSCWSFSVTATVESIHRILYPMLYPIIDLAEQTLVSTCESGGDCSGGYFSAFNYVRDKGLPIESDDPYRARNSQCKANLQPAVKITRWAYVGDKGKQPTTEQLKQALITHGPLSVTVNGNWPNTTGVVTNCGGTSQNHMVNIEGFKDDPAYAANGGGYFKVRNSWNHTWGDKGYIRIAYNSKGGGKCYGLAQTAAYAVIDGVEDLSAYVGL